MTTGPARRLGAAADTSAVQLVLSVAAVVAVFVVADVPHVLLLGILLGVKDLLERRRQLLLRLEVWIRLVRPEGDALATAAFACIVE